MAIDELIAHYDALIDENNDPARDPAPLREYMDRWDGQAFLDALKLTKQKSVLEIGVGSGRLAARTAPLCGRLTGIDISPKTIVRAAENLAGYHNVALICGDFLSHDFTEVYDVIYSSLTFMHIEEKQAAVTKAAMLLCTGGRFVLSIDKSRSDCIHMGSRTLRIFPDTPQKIGACIRAARMTSETTLETEFAYILTAVK